MFKVRKDCFYSHRRILIVFCSEPSESSNSSSRASSPKPVAVVSSKYSTNVRINSDKLTSNDQQSKSRVKFDFDNDDINNNMFSMIDAIDSSDYRMY